MTKDGVTAAIRAAEEFIRRAKALVKQEPAFTGAESYFGSATSGALRRQSHELSRILSAMRKPYA